MTGRLDLLDAGLPAPAHGCFTGRAGGRSVEPWLGLNLGLHAEDEPRRVLGHRELVAAALGVADLVFAEQVHGAGVAVVDSSSSRARQRVMAGVDAVVTREPGLGLVVLAADCLPVLLADPDAGVVAAVHAGRQGLVAGVLQATVQAMAGLGADPARTTAVLGPSVCGSCYELPEAVADQVQRQVPGSRSTTRHGTPAVDLAAGAQAVLGTAGVPVVTRTGGCTLEQPERWYSYRRDGRTGRHAGVVRLQA